MKRRQIMESQHEKDDPEATVSWSLNRILPYGLFGVGEHRAVLAVRTLARVQHVDQARDVLQRQRNGIVPQRLLLVVRLVVAHFAEWLAD